MTGKWLRRIGQNRFLGWAAGALAALLYTALFCTVVLYTNLNRSLVKIDDQLYQRGVDFSNDILIIGITAEDLEERGTAAGLLAAELVEKLNEDSFFYPAAIGLDIPVTLIGEEEEACLLAACDERKNVVLPVDLSLPDDCYLNYFSLAEDGLLAETALLPPAALAERANIGHTAVVADASGAVRHAVFDILTEDGTVYASLPWVSYCLYCSAKGISARRLALSEQNTVLLKFADREKLGGMYSVSDILDGNFRREELDGKIVFVGFADSALQSGFLTSVDYNNAMYGAELDAHIVNALLSGSLSVVLPLWLQALLLACGVILVIVIVFRFKPFSALLALVIYVLLENIAAMLIYGVGYAGYSFPHLLNAMITGPVGIIAASFLRSRRKRQEVERVLGRYVDSNIAKNILDSSAELLKEEETEQKAVKTERIAVLFADIRNFTSIAERLPEERLVEMLNTVLSLSAECVNRFGGTLDKFIGDCTMAYWGAPGKDSDPVFHACQAAFEMQRMLRANHEKLEKTYGADIRLGIGVHYGPAVVGNIGSSNRTNFTAVGKTVNTASRLEEGAPADRIYLSQEAADRLGGRAELERLPSDILFKGKEQPIPVYELRSISAEKTPTREEEQALPFFTGDYRRGLLAVAADIFMFFIQFVFSVNCLRELSISFVAYFTVTLAAVSSAISAVLIPYDIQAARRGDGVNIRPRWLDILLLTGLGANLHCIMAFLIHVVPEEGLSAFLHSSWPGGLFIYAVCPVVSVFSFFVLQRRAHFRLTDVFLAELPLALLLLGSAALAGKLGIRYSAPKLYKAFYQFPETLLIVLAETGALGFLYLLNERLKLQEQLAKKRKKKKRSGRAAAAHPAPQPKNERLLSAGLFFGNLLIAGLSLKVPVDAFRVGGVRLYANPVLTTWLVLGISAAGAVLAARCFIKKEAFRNLRVFRYFSLMRCMGCSMNFLTIVLLAISDEGLTAFFTPHYGAGPAVFLLCPLAALLMWALEKNEYRFFKCLLTSIPYMLMLPLSRAAIISRGLGEQFRYELENFYNAKQMAIIIASMLVLSVLFYYMSMIFDPSRKVEKGLSLRVCGNRKHMSVGENTESRYGLLTECYVLRDGEYGLVIHAGSGLKNAVKQLAGCRRVDIVLCSREFYALAGFLAVGNVCPEARIHIYAPFDIGSFSVHPFWPVNLIRGTVTVAAPGKRYRLGKGYSLVFISGSRQESCMAKISGRTGLFVLGEERPPREKLRKLSSGAEWLLVSGCEDWEESCYLAADINVAHLLFSGFPGTMPDEELEKRREKAGKLLPGVVFARENDEYPA